MASSLLTEIVTIDEIKPHPNADRMDIAIIKGWQLCVAKNGYEVGMEGVYFTIDTMVPKEVAEALDFDKYLSFSNVDPGYGRVRSVRLRGEPSYGVFIPKDVIKEYLETITDKISIIKSENILDADKAIALNVILAVGMNLAETLGCKKWEPPLILNSQDAERDHGLFDKYTDIENFRNYNRVILEGEDVVITEKIHGCLDENTLITLGNGEKKRIKDIVEDENYIGSKILSYDFDKNKQTFDEIEFLYNNGESEDWVKLIFDNGIRLIVTENHIIHTKQGEIKAKDIEEYHEVIME